VQNLNQIIEGCREWKHGSQEALYREFFGYAMSISLRYAPNREEAIEILNDSFLKVFQHIDTFDIQRSFKSWLAKIVVNTAIDFLRSKSKISFVDNIEQIYDLGMEDKTLDHISYNELLKYVQTLPPAYRTVFNLYVMEGYHHQEIAALLSISEGTSKSNLFKAKKILKEKILRITPDIHPQDDGIKNILLSKNE
jgi:RNA polymerase sigma factor (sigma-70 family)